MDPCLPSHNPRGGGEAAAADSDGEPTAVRSPLPNWLCRPIEALAVVGVLRLRSGPVLCAVTSARKVALLRGHPVFEITGVEVLAPSSLSSDDKQ